MSECASVAEERGKLLLSLSTQKAALSLCDFNLPSVKLIYTQLKLPSFQGLDSLAITNIHI